MINAAVLSVFLTFVLFTACSPSPSQKQVQYIKVDLPSQNEASTKIVNRYRATHRKKQLKKDKRLTAIAQKMAEGMAARQTVSHNGARERRAEIYKLGYIYVAENIGFGVNEAHVAKMWYHSPPHRKAMLKSLMRYTGSGVARGGGMTYVCNIYAY